MIKNFNVKFLPVILLILINLYSVKIMAVEPEIRPNHQSIGIYSKVEISERLIKKGFLKRLFRKINEKVKTVSKRFSYNIKRIFSKRKAKKNRMRSSFKVRNRNLFNILIFSVCFLAVTSLLMFLYFSSVIGSVLFLISILAIGIFAVVLALIYFSGRYILKPHYRS